MAVFLFVIAILSGLAGLGFIGGATSVLHEIFGAMGIVTVAILFGAAAIVSAVDDLKHQLRSTEK